MDKRKMKKLLILNLPYFLVGLFATNLGEAWRLAEGADSSAKILSFFHALPIALNNPFPSFHPLDLLIGILCGAGLRLAVYLKGKNAKKYEEHRLRKRKVCTHHRRKSSNGAGIQTSERKRRRNIKCRHSAFVRGGFHGGNTPGKRRPKDADGIRGVVSV